MKTYINETKSELEIIFNSNGDGKQQRHIVKPGESLTFDETEDNGQSIIDECIEKGLEHGSDL